MNQVCETFDNKVCDGNFMQIYPGRLIEIMKYLKINDLLVLNELMSRVYYDFKNSVEKKDEKMSDTIRKALPNSRVPVLQGALMKEFDKL